MRESSLARGTPEGNFGPPCVPSLYIRRKQSVRSNAGPEETAPMRFASADHPASRGSVRRMIGKIDRPCGITLGTLDHFRHSRHLALVWHQGLDPHAGFVRRRGQRGCRK
jgi:hypothetical protein